MSLQHNTPHPYTSCYVQRPLGLPTGIASWLQPQPDMPAWCCLKSPHQQIQPTCADSCCLNRHYRLQTTAKPAQQGTAACTWLHLHQGTCWHSHALWHPRAPPPLPPQPGAACRLQTLWTRGQLQQASGPGLRMQAQQGEGYSVDLGAAKLNYCIGTQSGLKSQQRVSGANSPILLCKPSHPSAGSASSRNVACTLTNVEGCECCIRVAQAFVQAAHHGVHGSLARHNALQHTRSHTVPRPLPVELLGSKRAAAGRTASTKCRRTLYAEQP